LEVLGSATRERTPFGLSTFDGSRVWAVGDRGKILLGTAP
jgi:hypothetical protein